MRTAQHIFRSLTVALAATASLLLCLTVSCRRAPAPLPDDFGVTVLIDNPSSSDGTKAIADNEINSIAIFAFSGSELVGYVYESGLTGKTTFPMTLKASGAIDFYAIANPDPGYFLIVDANGQPIDLKGKSAANPPKYDADDISNWRVEIGQGENAQGDWYAPMTNLPGAGGTNRRYTINPDDNWTIIPLELTRAVSKIEVWFRAKNEVESWQEYKKYYFRLRDLRLESGVKNSFIFFEGQEYAVGAYSFNREFAREDPLFIQNFPDFSEGDSYYGDPYFEKIVEYYVMPNSIGGDQYGIFNGNESDKTKCTVLEINTIRTDRRYNYREVKYFWEDNNSETKQTTIYLPSINGNQIVKIWCDLSNENVDRSFTYTVVDWDETVEVNVPDFE